MPDALKEFGDRLRAIRTERGLSQEQLAALARLDRTYISGVERGMRNIGLRNIHRLAVALSVHPSEFFAGPTSPEDARRE